MRFLRLDFPYRKYIYISSKYDDHRECTFSIQTERLSSLSITFIILNEAKDQLNFLMKDKDLIL